MTPQLNLISPHLSPTHAHTHTNTHSKIACNNNNPTDDSFSPLPPIPSSPPHPHIQSNKASLLPCAWPILPSLSFFPLHQAIYTCSSPSVNPTTPNSNTLHSPNHPTAYSAALAPPINKALVCRFSIYPFFSAPVSLPLSLPLCLSLSPSLLAGAGEISGQTDSSFFLWLRGVVLCDLALGCISALLMCVCLCEGERKWERKHEREKDTARLYPFFGRGSHPL